jgi:hypothetical protein
MSFDLEVRISGICTFIPNADATGAHKICLVMPGGDTARFALDDELLCPHTSWIESLTDSVTLPRQPLHGMRVRFNVTPETPTGYPEVQLPSAGGADLADLRAVCGDYLHLDPAIVGFPPRGDILTQILLQEGRLECSGEAWWKIAALRGGTPTEKVLAHEVTLHLPALVDAKLVLEQFTGGRTDIPLAPDDDETVQLRLVNACREAYPKAPDQQPMRDRDFKWYYELMDEATRADIQGEILRNELPIPLFYRKGPKLIGGQNCFPARSAPVSFRSAPLLTLKQRLEALQARFQAANGAGNHQEA